jgi:UDPglucose 6-dehydrogenase/GDP-mannose 6-dehydrogenase
VRVSVVGVGYVGLVTAACLAEQGHDVVCADLDSAKVELIESGAAPIHEPDLDRLLARNVGRNLRATVDVEHAVSASDLTLLAVGTPTGPDGIDLRAVASATRTVGAAVGRKDGFHVFAVKSTVVPGTTDALVVPLLEAASGKAAGRDFGVGVNPEFLTEGQAVADFMAPDRLVLGAIDPRTHDMLEELYASFPATIPRLRTNTRTAEMIKYASNALLATMISFANEIGNLCTAVGDVDVVDVMRGVHLSDYLSPRGSGGERVYAPITSFLDAGSGFGGSCLPKDVRALIAEGDRLGQPMRLLRAVIETNVAQPDELLRIVESSVGDIRGRRVTVLGLAFKPGTDDVRESPSIPVVERLVERGAEVTIHDPIVTELPDELRECGSVLTADLRDAVQSADVVVLVTRWEQYRALPELLRELDPAPWFVDGRRMLDKDTIAGYAGIGLG